MKNSLVIGSFSALKLFFEPKIGRRGNVFLIMSYNKFPEDQIKEAAKNSKSIADMCRYLGLIPAGGNYASMKRRIAKYDVDVSHFTGQGWRKDQYLDQPNEKQSIKRKLIRERGHQCERCKHTEWFEIPITLELEHIDGNTTNNLEDNLLLLCPNCHSQTKTWRRKKSSFEPKPAILCAVCNEPKKYKSQICNTCRSNKIMTGAAKLCECGEVISHTAQQCVKCAHVKQQRTVWPTPEELVVRLRDNRESYTSVRKSLGVSDNSVRKYLRKHNIDPKTFKPITSEE